MRLPLGPFGGIGGETARKSDRLEPLQRFGSNPGQLNAWTFIPEPTSSEAATPLVVVLHGCTQTAAGYDHGSGWSELAAAYGFAVLFPEQQRSNNANLCFNWFEPDDTRRGAGEGLSIAQMVEALIAHKKIDPQRVFITGLSAGGAMASVMLATYPELFAGGAIVAGLPSGAAANVAEAFQQMRSPLPAPGASGSAITRASRHTGRWPTIAIWHGTADNVVHPSNAEALVRQWTEVHGIARRTAEEDIVDGTPHRVWRDAEGRAVVEEYRVTGMGHGTPLSTVGECGYGNAGAFMLEVGISATVHSAAAWGLLSTGRPVSSALAAEQSVDQPFRQAADEPKSGRVPHGTDRIRAIIDEALRKAGLIK